MSLILDALRRSEGEGSAASPEPALPAKQSYLVGKKWLAAGFLVFAGLGIGAGWMIRGGVTNPMNEGQVDVLANRLPSAGYGVASQSFPRPDVLRPAPTEKASASDALVAEADLSEPAALENNESAAVSRLQKEGILALHKQMWADAEALAEMEEDVFVQEGAPISVNASPDSSSIAPPIDLVAAIERAARQVGEPNLIPHPTVLLENLSQQQKDQIPTIVYTEHNYVENPSSSVELNGQLLRLGERVGSFMVEDILVDSVILRVNGFSFRLRALNTWVNL